MGNKLYVGNLNFNVDDASLAEQFGQFGTVDSARVIIDREMNRSRGFGFVEMSTDEEAQAAIDALDGQDFEGRKLRVNVARPRENNNRQGGGGRGGNFNDRQRY